MNRPDILPPAPARDIEERLQRVELLHIKGRTATQIANAVGVTPQTVRRDLRRIDAARQERLARALRAEQLRSVGVYRQLQAVLWKVVDALMENSDNKSVAGAAPAIIDSEKAVQAILTRLATENDGAEPTVSRMISQRTDAELDDVTPEEVAAWDAESDRDGL